MSYIGNSPTSVAFLTDTFSGNGTTTAFTMSVAPATTSSMLVAITGVVQDPSTYSIVGTTLTFSAAPPSGTGNISVRYLGIPASGVTTTAYRTVTEFTATAGQTTFTPPSYTVGYISVYRNGVMLGSADYTASNGTTVVLAAAATAGDLVTTESFYVSSVLNALPQTGGTIGGNLIVTGTETVPTITSPSATALTLQSAGTTAITVDTSQNVGIGTSSPSAKLNVSGSGDITALIQTTTAGVYLDLDTPASPSDYKCIFGKTNGTRKWGVGNFGTGNDAVLSFYTGSPISERMRIDSNGNVGIGTSAFGVLTSNGFAFNNPGAASNFAVFTSSSTTATDEVLNINRNAAVTSGECIQFYRLGVSVGGITVSSGSTAYVTTSDYRLKDNIQPLTNALDRISLLKPCTYTWKEDGSSGEGFIAHELQEILPWAVHGEKDGIEIKKSIDANGNDIEEEIPSYQGVDTSFLVATLTAAIQEQQAIITDLKERIEVLEGSK